MTDRNNTDLREQLVAKLVDEGYIRTPAVRSAFAAVDRARFVPRAAPEQAYSFDAVPTQWEDGRTASSMSAPWLQAEMLEAASVTAGMDVLEIGSGGCNAAMLAACVGPSGTVTSLDIDEAVVNTAIRVFPFDQYPNVTIRVGDAWNLRLDERSFDVIIITVDCRWIPAAFTAALRPGGRLIAPVRINGVGRCVELVKPTGGGGEIAGRVGHDCGFVVARGLGARTLDRVEETPGDNEFLTWSPSLLPGPPSVATRRVVIPTKESAVALDIGRSSTGLWLWLMGGLGPMPMWGTSNQRRGTRFDGLAPMGTPVFTRGDSFALWGWPEPEERENELVPLPVLGAGPAAEELATILIRESQAWIEAGRPHEPSCRLLPHGQDPHAPGRHITQTLGPDFDLIVDWDDAAGT